MEDSSVKEFSVGIEALVETGRKYNIDLTPYAKEGVTVMELDEIFQSLLTMKSKDSSDDMIITILPGKACFVRVVKNVGSSKESSIYEVEEYSIDIEEVKRRLEENIDIGELIYREII